MLAVVVTVGTIAQWLTLAALVGGFFLFARGGGGTALASLETANRVLERRVHDLETQAKADALTIAELRARTDVGTAMRPLVQAVVDHEKQSDARFAKTVVILELIASRLGADGDDA